MKRKLTAAALALACMAACDKGSMMSSSYTSITGFEVPESVQRSFFNDDGIHLEDYFFFDDGSLVFYASQTDGEAFKGGIALASAFDATVEEGHGNDFKAFSSNGAYRGSTGYALVKDGGAQNPGHFIRFTADNGTCAPSLVYVNNVNSVVNAFYYGTAAGIERKDGDIVKLKATGSLGGRVTGTAEIALIDCAHFKEDSVVTSWTKLDLSPLGQVDAVDFTIESDIEDLPPYAAIDLFVANMTFKLE